MLFRFIFGPRFDRLPAAWQQFHSVKDRHIYEGEAEVARGTGFVASVLCLLLRLPQTGAVPVQLVLEKEGKGERWARTFGASSFETRLSPAHSERGYFLYERFFPFCFFVELEVVGETVGWHLRGWRFFGVPLPRLFIPKSKTVERVDAEGRYQFDIELSLPLFGRLIAYQGWLLPQQ